jgi:predicted negative regulator of RcsB-dependent stress response
MNTNPVSLKTIAIAAGAALVLFFVLPALLGFLFQLLLPAILLGAVGIGGWWVIRLLQGVDATQAALEFKQVGNELRGKAGTLTDKAIPATKSAVETFRREITK